AHRRCSCRPPGRASAIPCSNPTFVGLLRDSGVGRSAPRRPTVHDLRRSFTVATPVRCYHDGGAHAGTVDLSRPRRPVRDVWLPARPARAAPTTRGSLEATLRSPAMTALAPTRQAFFTDRLIGQRQASAHTVAAYRDTFRLLLCFAEAHLGKAPSVLDIED